ncbi:hypothetical protein [Streptomyces sp. AS02]|uniref:hypothetical protein n=1 Tax=Streptomyces sp. AS02 TaxID=2938946 RepID=UPI00202116FC|nr:hypothetical protein [Streptomyces sp. AS02]MCL8014946.1 hypothetical protein [Streptomyces sp. AS02]
MSAQTSRHDSDTLPTETADVTVIGGAGRAAGNATDLTAQVGASAAAGAHISALLATPDTDATLAAAQAANTAA